MAPKKPVEVWLKSDRDICARNYAPPSKVKVFDAETGEFIRYEKPTIFDEVKRNLVRIIV